MRRPSRPLALKVTLLLFFIGWLSLSWTSINLSERNLHIVRSKNHPLLLEQEGWVTPMTDTLGEKDTSLLQSHIFNYNPISCPTFLEHNEIKDPNNGTVYKNLISLDDKDDTRAFWVSVHNKDFDPMRWTLYKKGTYYEKDQTPVFAEILRQAAPGSRILDVGGNIGIYSLLSASMGAFQVDSFEPNAVNILRFCQSLHLNHWTSEPLLSNGMKYGTESPPHVNLHQYGISNVEGLFNFHEHHKNPGGGSFAFQRNKEASEKGLRVTTLDAFARSRNWFETRPDVAILKIDVEGSEGRVVMGARNLLERQIVQNIIMEISIFSQAMRRPVARALKTIVAAGYRLKRFGGETGPGRDYPWPQDEQFVDKIIDICMETRRKKLNLWWHLPQPSEQ